MSNEPLPVHLTRAMLKEMTTPYQGSRLTSSIYQLLNTFPPFVLVCALMYASLFVLWADIGPQYHCCWTDSSDIHHST
jgi:hypothetical protein